MNKFISIPNWEELQHYKDRTPPWIKLHNSILETYEFELLPDNSKAHLLCIMLLASRTNNKIKADPRYIARRIGATTKVDLDILLESGLITIKQEVKRQEQDASKMLQKQEQDAIEKRGEEKRGEENICQLVADEYNKILGSELGKVISLSKKRESNIKSCVSQMEKTEHDFSKVSTWSSFFSYIKKSDFLMGRSSEWSAGFDFIINKSNLLKIIEGNYENKSKPVDSYKPREFSQ